MHAEPTTPGLAPVELHDDLAARPDRLHGIAVFFTMLPIVAATVLTIWVSAESMKMRLLMPFAQNPWESAILADAWRFANGQRVFENRNTGHATHMYGPLTSPTIGVIYKLTGVTSYYTGRILTLACALSACAILLWIYARRTPMVLLIGAGLLIGLHYRGRAYFVETRPDMVALLLATLGLICCYFAYTRDRLWLYVVGAGWCVLAMLFKQTYLAATGVPLLAVLISGPKWKHLAGALAPLAVAGITLLLLKRYTPNVYFYMVEMPSMYEIRQDRLMLGAGYLLTLSPLFIAMVLWYVLHRRQPELRSPKIMWLIAAIIVGCAASLPVYAKRGGSFNSLLLGWIPMTVFCVAMLGPVLQQLNFPRPRELVGVAGGWFIALLIAATTLTVPNSALWNFEGAHGGPIEQGWGANAQYFPRMIEHVRELDGKVASPDDPMILIFAKGEACRSLEAELDANERPPLIPMGLWNELRSAKWLVRSHAHYDSYLTDDMMNQLGFVRQMDKRVAGNFTRFYSLWIREKKAAPQPIEPPPKKRPKIRREP